MKRLYETLGIFINIINLKDWISQNRKIIAYGLKRVLVLY
jgi:hypothetical protein